MKRLQDQGTELPTLKLVLWESSRGSVVSKSNVCTLFLSSAANSWALVLMSGKLKKSIRFKTYKRSGSNHSRSRKDIRSGPCWPGTHSFSTLSPTGVQHESRIYAFARGYRPHRQVSRPHSVESNPGGQQETRVCV